MAHSLYKPSGRLGRGTPIGLNVNEILNKLQFFLVNVSSCTDSTMTVAFNYWLHAGPGYISVKGGPESLYFDPSRKSV